MSWLIVLSFVVAGGTILNCPLTQNTSTHLICKIFKNTNIDQVFPNHNFTENNYCSHEYINCSDGVNINAIIIEKTNLNGTLDLTYPWPLTMKEIDLEQSNVHSTNVYGTWNWTQFTNMPNFVELDLERNEISGTISNADWEILASLPKLINLLLKKNNFQVNFTEIHLNKSFAALQWLSIPDNIMYGTLDTSLNGFFTHFPNLAGFHIYTTQNKGDGISGHFDNFNCISNVNLPHLEAFAITDNHFSGSLTLSSNYSFSPSLKRFRIDWNNFGGTVDWNIFSGLNDLYEIDIQHNQFNGTIDWSIISNLVINGDLHLIKLDSNGFKGYINYSWIPNKQPFELKLDLNIHCHPDVYPCSGSTLNRSFKLCHNRTHCESSCQCLSAPTMTQFPSYTPSNDPTKAPSNDPTTTMSPTTISSESPSYQLYGFNISFNMDLTFDNRNNDELLIICNTYFSTIYQMRLSLTNIDAVFEEILNSIQQIPPYNLIHSVSKRPTTILRNGLNKLNCSNIHRSTEFTTDLAILSMNGHKDNIYPLFVVDSEFIISSKEEIEKLFTPHIVVVNITQIVIIDVVVIEQTPDGVVGIDFKLLLLIIVVAILLFFLLIFLSIYYCRKYKANKLKRKQLTVTIKHPMIIAIGIGTYDDDKYHDLDVDIDIINIAKLFQETLHYQLDPPFNKDNIRLYWTQKDLMQFLLKKAKQFNDKKDEYDGLVVIISCHGVENYIITSDICGIERNAIHRLFSYYFPQIRDKPRLFIFDACDGGEERNYRPRGWSVSDHEQINQQKSIVLQGLEGDDEKEGEENEENIYINGKVVDLEYIANLNPSDEAAWNAYEHNPDYAMAIIHSSNVGYQSRIDSVKGSLFMHQFVNRMIDNISKHDNKYFLFNILDDIQQYLHNIEKKQLTVNVLNHQTRYIKFIMNEEEEIKTHEAGGVDARSNVIETEMIEATKSNDDTL